MNHLDPNEPQDHKPKWLYEGADFRVCRICGCSQTRKYRDVFNWGAPKSSWWDVTKPGYRVTPVYRKIEYWAGPFRLLTRQVVDRYRYWVGGCEVDMQGRSTSTTGILPPVIIRLF